MSDKSTTETDSSPLGQVLAGATIPAKGVGKVIQTQQFASLIVLAAVITLGIGLIMYALKPEYIAVGQQYQTEDIGDLATVLAESGIRYRIDPDTGTVLVPRKSMTEVKLLLASNGLSGSSERGLEILEQNNSLGTSQFVQNARYQHALETELSRTISSLRNIRDARVHLAIPKQSVFIRNQGKVSASVIVHPLAGRTVETGQVASIVNLVASSIPYLESNNVTVVDQWGRLLSKTLSNTASDLTNAQFDYTRKLESLLIQRVESLLTPLVGEGRLRVSVTADVDFTQNESTQEIYESDPTQIRSEEVQTSQSTRANVNATGVAGALSNQPDGITPPATSPSRGGDINNQTTRNYELDKTIRHTRQSPSMLRRLSAAIIVDDRLVTSESGEETRVSVTPDELDKLTALAKEAIGFDETRGDSVIVFNQTFQPTEFELDVTPQPFWQDVAVVELVRQGFVGLALLILVFVVVKPATRVLLQRSGPAQLDNSGNTTPTLASGADTSAAETGEAGESSGAAAPLPDQVTAQYGNVLDATRVMAQQNPERVARVVKDWVVEKERAG